jgi:hypothetical protein
MRTKRHSLPPEATIHHRQALVREAMLLLAIMLVALLLQAGGHQIPVLVLDSILISGGLIGALAAIFLSDNSDSRWFLALSVITIIAGATQLFLSSGMAVGFLVLIAALPIGDALANLLILGRQIWLGFHDGR